jgi:septal ring factor EnvC (AmiA/AmiB activator)
MEEDIKNRAIVILAILSIIFLMGVIRSCNMAGELKRTLIELDKEKAVSWDSQQQMNELKKEKAALEKELEDTKAENETTKKALLQEQLVSQSLKEELQKVTKLKERLEDDLKDVLVKDKSKSAK